MQNNKDTRKQHPFHSHSIAITLIRLYASSIQLRDSLIISLLIHPSKSYPSTTTPLSNLCNGQWVVRYACFVSPQCRHLATPAFSRSHVQFNPITLCCSGGYHLAPAPTHHPHGTTISSPEKNFPTRARPNEKKEKVTSKSSSRGEKKN